MELVRKTIERDEEFLRQVSEQVDLEKDNYMEWIDMIKEYCKNNVCYALAPVQIGIPKRLIYIRNTSEDMSKNMNSEYDESQIFINPVIVSKKGHTRFLEGCESCTYYDDQKRIFLVGMIDRPYMIEVEYYDIKGQKHLETFEGFKATVFSHEYDHLEGIIHLDLTSEIMSMTYEEVKEFRKNHPQEIISKDCEFINDKQKYKNMN